MTPLLLFLIGCAMVYVGSVQAAFAALMRLSLRLMAERGDRSEALERYLEDPPLLFIPTRLLLALLLVVAGGLLARAIGVEGWHRFGLLVLAGAVFGLVCEHLLPLLVVRRNPQRVLEVLLPSFGLVATALRPLTSALHGLLVRRTRTPATDMEPVTSAGETAPPGEAPVADIDGEGRRLLRSIVDFSDRLVREVMTPRPDIVAIAANATLDELRAFFREQEYSRIPVYKGDLDNILGFVVVKDLIKHDADAGGTPVTDLLRPAYFVPETKRVPDLLKEFQRNRVQSAIVVDEYGGTAGLVSLEDLIEEIVGEIRDEYDVEAEPVVEEAGGAVVFSGKVDVDRLAERFGIAIEREGFETVGGYLLARVGRVPAVGETFERDGLAFEVIEAERRRVHKVRVRALEESPTGGE